jgi:hypothetical protein
MPCNYPIKHALMAGAAALFAITVVQAAEPPDREQKFIEIVQRASTAYDNATNDMAKGAARAARAQDICAWARGGSGTVTWVGAIETLSSTGNGKGVLSVSIAPHISFTTWNNTLSDIGDKTLIDPMSAVGKAATSMHIGQLVGYHGKVFPSDDDCMREISMTLEGSMHDPEYLLRFDMIKPVP